MQCRIQSFIREYEDELKFFRIKEIQSILYIRLYKIRSMQEFLHEINWVFIVKKPIITVTHTKKNDNFFFVFSN
jgi:hypothetical protein